MERAIELLETWRANTQKATADEVARSVTAVQTLIEAKLLDLLNQVNFNGPGNLIQSPGTFGVSTSIVGNPDGTTGARQMQFAAKIVF